MKRKIIILVLCLCMVALFSACDTQANETITITAEGNNSNQLEIRFSDAKEGAEFITGNTDFLNGLNQNDLCYRMQKNDATLEEYITFAANQTLDFTEEEKVAVVAGMQEIMNICGRNDYVLPDIGEITFVKTTMEEEGGGISAYTHDTQIYLQDVFLLYLQSENQSLLEQGICLLAHELFHCLTRNDVQFRKDMYEIIGFSIQEEEFEFSSEIQEKMISNPDVGKHNSYATFRIEGQDRECAMVVTATRPFEKSGDSMWQIVNVGLVPIDDLSVMYSTEQAENFWEVIGRNTDYILDPEEIMADNFSYAIMYGVDGEKYDSPEIIQAICEYLKK